MDTPASSPIARPKPPSSPRLAAELLQDPVDDLDGPEDGYALYSQRFLDGLRLDEEGLIAEFVACEIVKLEVAASVELEFLDCVVRNSELVGQNLSGPLVRTRFVDCKFSAVDFTASGLTDVTFEQCVLLSPSFQSARLKRVEFRSCKIESADLAEAALTDVSFPESALLRPNLPHTKVERVDVSGASEFVATRAADLAGWILAYDQVQGMAVGIAEELGMMVKDYKPSASED